MRAKSGNWASSFLCLSTVITSFAVIVPCSFWPLSLLFSMSSHVPSPLANASAQARLRPPKQVVTRSARPHDSMKVSSWIPLKKRRANLAVSLSPIRMIAAFVFPPYPSPSQKPAPSATTFFNAPQSSTPATSLILPTRNVGQSNSFCHTAPAPSVANPTVDSQNSSAATSLATLAPISTEVSMPPIESLMMPEMRRGPPSSNSMPLISEMALQSGPSSAVCSASNLRNWCGVTKMSSVAPLTALMMSGSATTLLVNVLPLRYLTFSCFSLMMSVRFLPSTCSWYTHIRTSSSKSPSSSRFRPTTLAIAEPQFPEPMMATFSFLAPPRSERRLVAPAVPSSEARSSAPACIVSKLDEGAKQRGILFNDLRNRQLKKCAPPGAGYSNSSSGPTHSAASSKLTSTSEKSPVRRTTARASFVRRSYSCPRRSLCSPARMSTGAPRCFGSTVSTAEVERPSTSRPGGSSNRSESVCAPLTSTTLPFLL
mmetsp:Transcript_8613/g.25309  ORF Transcript_8613/g.25309 Transcript_8613/m.25309 type:complete len:484 (-) Transcript_8613:110-1561(-)